MKTYKGYYIKPDKITPNNCVIVTEGRGGKIPNVLDGLFTSIQTAVNAIDKYLMVKEVANDEKVDKSRGK